MIGVITAAAAVVAVGFVVLHRIDGGEVLVSPRHVTSLRSPAGPARGLMPGHCVVGLTDGKFVGVLEACATVKDLLERAR